MLQINFRQIIFTSLFVSFLVTRAQAYCFEEAGQRYAVSPLLLYAISSVESDFDTRAVNVNTNGSMDRGHMQINSFWKPYIGDEGWNALFDPCYCTNVGAWIMSQCVEQYGNTWDAVACYHCGHCPEEMTPSKRNEAYKYIRRVQRELNELRIEQGRVGE